MKDTAMVVANYGMGKADEKLQLTLISKYFDLILQNGNLPALICFYTEGVKLVCEGLPVVEQLRALESKVFVRYNPRHNQRPRLICNAWKSQSSLPIIPSR